ncbi:LytR/AlgR family response regulator transcription factor [Clostridium perfringens]|nr:response regulator [Clostridium perfringens]NGT58535.1 response regulator [Clostridium perfringens]
MINIGICDDDQRFLNELALKINNLNIVDSESLQVEKFISGENLIFELEENPNRFSILIVDIVMNGINGIEVSKILRRYGYDGIIIFLTSSKEYALESFEVFPMAYILKENIDNVFEEILLKAIKNLKVNTVKK